MSFSNQTLSLDDLPHLRTVDWIPMPPEHRREIRIELAIFLGILLLAGVSAAIASYLAPAATTLKVVLALGFTLLIVLWLGIAWLALQRVRRKGYALREHDLAFRSGVIFRKQVVLPFNRIQHVEVSSGPLQRRFGLATLKCFTAGGTDVDLSIGSLLQNDAERLRELVLSRCTHLQDLQNH